MPPRQDGPPKTFTWITGDPRSRQNVSQIRRHAGRSSAVKTALASSAFLKQPPQASSSAISPYAAQDVFFHIEPDTTTTTSPPVLHPAFRPSEGLISSTAAVVPPVRKLTIEELVNAPEKPGVESQRKPSSPSSTWDGDLIQDQRTPDQGTTTGHPSLKNKLSTTRRRPARRGTKASTTLSTSKAVIRANISKCRKPAPTASQISWRIAVAPIPATLSHDESRIVHILLQASANYSGRVECTWSHTLHVSPTTLDETSPIENSSGITTTPAALVPINRIDTASVLLSRILPRLQSLLDSEYQHLYHALAGTLDTSNTDLSRLRALGDPVSSNSQVTLSPHHRIIYLLLIQLALSSTLRLRELIQRRSTPLHENSFHLDSDQTISQSGVLACLLSHFISMWEATYGHNTLLPVNGLLEVAKVLLAQGKP